MTDLSSCSNAHTTLDSFHDCEVTAISTTGLGGEVNIMVACPVCGAKSTIILQGLFRLRINNFLEGNTILDADQSDASRAPQELLQTLFDVNDVQYTAIQEDVSDEIAENQLVLFELNPSYGCEILALCRFVEIRQSSQR